jgi:hypothetical protein
VTKRIDKIGICFALVLAALALGAAYAALQFGWFRSEWQLALWLFVGFAFIAAGLGVHSHRPPKNTSVYGAAQPAPESEAQAAARGNTKSASLHDQTFRD